MINTIEPNKWDDYIKELNTPHWRKSHWWTWTKNVAWFLVGVAFASFTDGYVGNLGSRAADLTVNIFGKSQSQPVNQAQEIEKGMNSKVEQEATP